MNRSGTLFIFRLNIVTNMCYPTVGQSVKSTTHKITAGFRLTIQRLGIKHKRTNVALSLCNSKNGRGTANTKRCGGGACVCICVHCSLRRHNNDTNDDDDIPATALAAAAAAAGLYK